jgi:hypothetical protein
MAKHQLYNHCDVVTTVDRENNTVHVDVAYKPHVLESEVRVVYTANDVLDAVRQSGIPVADIASGHARTLNNRTTMYTSSSYVLSLIPKKEVEQPAECEVAEVPKPKPKPKRKPRTQTPAK